MKDASKTSRLAIGIFHEPLQLGCALAGLHAIGLTSSELCLAGTRQAFDRLNASVANRDSLLLAGRLDLLLPIERDVLATSVALQPQADMLVTSTGISSHFFELLVGVQSELSDEAIALLVSASSSNSLRDSSKILLRHSSNAIQTHEFPACT